MSVGDIHFESSDRFSYIDDELDQEDFLKIINAIKNNPTIPKYLKDKIAPADNT